MLRGLECVRELARAAHDPHAASAAARRRLDDDGAADVLRDFERLVLALDRDVAARQNRDTGLAHPAPSAGFVGHQPYHLRIGTDELDVARSAHFGEVGTLGKESVTWMDRVGA